MENLTTDQWLEIIGHILSALGLVITIYIAYKGYQWAQNNWLAQKKIENDTWQKQKEVENNHLRDLRNEQSALNRLKLEYQSKTDACKAAWRLIAYMSERDNPKAMFGSEGNEFSLNIKNGEEFFGEVQRVVFDEGHGIFLPQDIRRSLFKYRSSVGGVLYSDESVQVKDKITITNPDLIKYFRRAKDELTVALREAVTL